MTLVWTKHPDSSKIGKTVQRGYYNSSTNMAENLQDLEGEDVLTGLDPRFMSSFSERRHLESHEIECADFSWLPTGTTDAPQKIHIARWDSEDSALNPETGSNENRTIGGAYGLEFVRTTPRTLKVNAVANITSDLIDLLNSAANSSLSLKTGGQICQVGLSSNLLVEVLPVYDGLGAMKPSPAQAADYIVGSDRYLELRQLNYTLENWRNIFKPAESSVYFGQVLQ
jgi:hypothetical protein